MEGFKVFLGFSSKYFDIIWGSVEDKMYINIENFVLRGATIFPFDGYVSIKYSPNVVPGESLKLIDSIFGTYDGGVEGNGDRLVYSVIVGDPDWIPCRP